MSDVVIKCSGLAKVFRDFWFRNRVRAVDGIDMDVRQGEVFGLLGPNGSGKSTAIKMILGLLYPTAGRIAVFGKRPDDVAIKKRIGYLPEESYLYRFLNARETLEYYGRLFGQGRSQRQRRIDMLLKMVGLDAVWRRPLGEYSKGMQRRIGLAQALINDPQLLILDEPTTGMDPIGTRQIKDLILTLKQRGKTILLCSHLLADVEDICDRVAVMYGGKIQRLSAVDDLLTEQDVTTIRTQKLDAEMIEQIEQLLVRHGRHIDRVEQPRQKLESLFLEIVRQAQSRGAATSGAHSGGRIAEFLAVPVTGESRDAHLPQEMDPAKLIDKLVSESQDPATAPTPASSASSSVDDTTRHGALPEVSGSDEDVIAGLTGQTTPPAPVPPTPVPTQTPNETNEEKPDQSFMDALMKAPRYEQDDDPSKRQEQEQ